MAPNRRNFLRAIRMASSSDPKRLMLVGHNPRHA